MNRVKYYLEIVYKVGRLRQECIGMNFDVLPPTIVGIYCENVAWYPRNVYLYFLFCELIWTYMIHFYSSPSTPDDSQDSGTRSIEKLEDVVLSPNPKAEDCMRRGSAGEAGSMKLLKSYQSMHVPFTQVSINNYPSFAIFPPFILSKSFKDTIDDILSS